MILHAPRFILRSKVPFIPQMETAECGAAALAMVMAFHGCNVPLSQLRHECQVSRDGTSALNIVRTAEKYGFSSKGLSLEPENLVELELPAILHWGFSHFVVLEAVNQRLVRIVDPGTGPLNISLEELHRTFTGVAILVIPTHRTMVKKRLRSPLWKYLSIFRGVKNSLAQLLSTSLLVQCLGLSFAISAQLIIDQVVTYRRGDLIVLIIIAFAVTILCKASIGFLRGVVLQNAQFHIDRTLRAAFVEHVVRLPLPFLNQRRVGDLVSRIQANSTIRDSVETSVARALDGIFVFVYLGLMFFYNVTLTVSVLVITLARIFVQLGLKRDNATVISGEMAAVGKEWDTLIETLSSAETMIASGAQARMIRRGFNAMVHRVNQGAQRRHIEHRSAQFASVMQGLNLAALLVVGCTEMSKRALTVGQFAAFLTIQHLFTTPFETLMTSISQLQHFKLHLLRLDDVFATKTSTNGSKEIKALGGSISLREVSCAYSLGGPLVLKRVGLDIAAGEKLALVGRSGSGKSTLIRVLLGLLQPVEGSVVFDDSYSIADVEFSGIKSKIGSVLQDCFLFDDTIRNNLSMYDPDVTAEGIKAALELACLDEEVYKLPLGLETRLQAEGRRLSGGQRQRLCIARALLAKPSILLLDEATSALDESIQARLYANIAKMRCTCILVTHRVATLKSFDRIVVLQDGEVIQEGSFQALSERTGGFRDLLATGNKTYGSN